MVDDFDQIELTLSPGWMGDQTKWCFWESEYPEDGCHGPYDSEQEARDAIAEWAKTDPVFVARVLVGNQIDKYYKKP